MCLLFVDLRLVGIVCVVIKALFSLFHSAVITEELQEKGEIPWPCYRLWVL